MSSSAAHLLLAPDVFLEIVFFRGTRIALWLREKPRALNIPGMEGRIENELVSGRFRLSSGRSYTFVQVGMLFFSVTVSSSLYLGSFLLLEGDNVTAQTH